MQYPGQRVQIDVKFVPSACLVGGAAEEKFYQYTFIDEYSRFRYLKAFKEHSTYSSTQFLKHVVEKFPYMRLSVFRQTMALSLPTKWATAKRSPNPIWKTLAQFGIRHKKIRPFTPRHNDKLERSHRKDNEYFFASHTFYSFEDFQKQLAVHQRYYNDFPIRPLNWCSPKQVLLSFSHFVTHHWQTYNNFYKF